MTHTYFDYLGAGLLFTLLTTAAAALIAACWCDQSDRSAKAVFWIAVVIIIVFCPLVGYATHLIGAWK